MLKYIALVGAVIAAFYSLLRRDRPPLVSLKLSPAELRSSYDYVIVGGGSAGSVLAARLSESANNYTVLLIEAGDVPPHYSRVPLYLNSLQLTNLDWQYRSVPQKHGCKALKNQQCVIPRGKALGGSSSINYMQYTRGHPDDYNQWAKLLNDTSWAYENVLPYFKKSENIQVETLKNSEFHHSGGPLPVGPSAHTKLGEVFMAAAKTAGFAIHDDYNDLADDGFAYVQQTAFRGERYSTYDAFLHPSMNRHNLDVLTNAHVAKIEFGALRARRVRFIWEAQEYTIECGREIIVAAGAIATPQLLLLSGLGPAEELRRLNISIVKDMPAVGRHMCDHYAVDMLYAFNESIMGDKLQLASTPGFLAAQLEYYMFGTGPLAFSPLEITGWAHSLLEKDTRPSVELCLLDGPLITAAARRDFLAGYGASETNHTASFIAFLSRPHSEGFITLQSTNPFVHPLIEMRMFDNDLDVPILIEGVKKMMNVASAPEFKRYDARIAEKPLPGCRNHKFLSDEYLDCSIRHRAYPCFHPACTCRMGRDDRQSVLASDFRVHGIRGLRVVDASAFPEHVSGNTNAPVIMMAEKAADMILQADIP